MKLVLPYNNMLSLYFLHFQSKEQVLRHKTEKQIFNLIFTNDLVSIFLYEKNKCVVQLCKKCICLTLTV